MPLWKTSNYTSETVSRFSQETHLLHHFMNPKSQLPPAWRTNHLYQQWGTFLSWCITKHSRFRWSFNLFPEHFSGFENQEAILFAGVLRRGNYYQTLLHFTLQTLQLHSCGTSIPTALPDLLSPNVMSCIWEHYGYLPLIRGFMDDLL